MTRFSQNKSFVKDILFLLKYIAVIVAIFFMIFLHSSSRQDINIALKNIEPTVSLSTATFTPKPTEKPTATPRTVYIPDPEELQEIPDIHTLDLLEDNIYATEKLTLSWEKQNDADYYLLCVLDDENNVIQKEILWADVTEWEIANFGGMHILLLCYKDMGKDGTDDDKLLNSYTLEVDSKEDLAQQILMNVIPEKRYYILVDKEDFSFAIFSLDENMEYTNVIATFPCALGRSSRMTPNGKFKISSKGDWKTWKTGEYSPYYTRYTSGLYIHGALYSKKNFGSMISEYYERIGTNHTSGCVRTTLEGARWIYYNCPAGTVVEIVSSSDLVDHVERPDIDPDYPTWDPTDPNKPCD